jgi:hypothetical protein
MVQGSPFEAKDTDLYGKPLTDSKNQPRVEYYVGVAIEKNQFLQEVWPHMVNAANATMAAHVSSPKFAWKIIDGDGVDDKGAPYSVREGFAGNYILKCCSGFAPKVVDQQGNYLHAVDSVKRGYYTRVGVTFTGNQNPQYPGIYVNLHFLQLCGYGPEISTGPDVTAMVKSAPSYALPPGASATPVAPTGAPAVPQAHPGHSSPAGVPGGRPNPQAQPPAASVSGGLPTSPVAPGTTYHSNVVPNHGFVNNA